MVIKKMNSYPELRFEKKDSISSKILICLNCGSDKTYQLGSDLCCGNCGLCELVRRSDWMTLLNELMFREMDLPDLLPDVIPKERKPLDSPEEPDIEFEEEDVI